VKEKYKDILLRVQLLRKSGFVLRFLVKFLKDSRKGKRPQSTASGLFPFAVEGDTYFFHWLSFVKK